MAGTQIVVRVDDDLLTWVDRQRGKESRASFLRRAAEQARDGSAAPLASARRSRSRAKVEASPDLLDHASCLHPKPARRVLPYGATCGDCGLLNPPR